METTYSALNDVLVVLFREIMDIEEKANKSTEFADLTNNETHVIDAIGIGEKKKMSEIASELFVTLGSLTTAVNGLVRKNYVVRERGENDRRVVYVSLSEKGREAYEHHRKFHEEMIEAIIEGMSEEEQEVLTETLTRISKWFRGKQSENFARKRK